MSNDINKIGKSTDTVDLTRQEARVAHYIANGFLMKEIADKLFISIHTVKTHYEHIRSKLHAKNIAEVTRNYILSLDNPKDVLKMLPFLVIQLYVIFNDLPIDMRRVKSSAKVRVERVQRRTKEFDYGFI